VSPEIQITDGEDMLNGEDCALPDQAIMFTRKRYAVYYPEKLGRIVYYTKTSDSPSCTTPTTSTMPLRTLLGPTAGRSSFYSNESSNISVSSVNMLTTKTLCKYRYTTPSSKTNQLGQICLRGNKGARQLLVSQR